MFFVVEYVIRLTSEKPRTRRLWRTHKKGLFSVFVQLFFFQILVTIVLNFLPGFIWRFLQPCKVLALRAELNINLNPLWFLTAIYVFILLKKTKSKIRTVLHSDELTECVQDGGEYYTVSSFISKRSDKRFFLNNRTYNFVFFIDQLLSNSINYFIAFLFSRGGNSLGKKPLNSRLLVTVPCLNIHNPCTFLFLYTNQKMYWMYFSLSPYFCTKSCLSI